LKAQEKVVKGVLMPAAAAIEISPKKLSLALF
jgi:hypothetical protein